MELNKINIGEQPSDGKGDPLRVAFEKINENIETLENIITVTENSVLSVAGRVGHVKLTVHDILGAVTPQQFNTAIETHTHESTAITNFSNAVKETVGTAIAGDGTVTVEYDSETGTTTISIGSIPSEVSNASDAARDAQLAIWLGM